MQIHQSPKHQSGAQSPIFHTCTYHQNSKILLKGYFIEHMHQIHSLAFRSFPAYFLKHFKNKIHADYTSSVDIDETSFVSKCTPHILGAKCDIRLDRHFKTVELSGIGFKKWREERFSRIAQSLFKRLMQEMDSMIEDHSQDESMSEELSDLPVQQEDQICEQTTRHENDVNVNVLRNGLNRTFCGVSARF